MPKVDLTAHEKDVALYSNKAVAKFNNCAVWDFRPLLKKFSTFRLLVFHSILGTFYIKGAVAPDFLK